MSKNINIQDLLEQSKKSDSGLKVPNGYFENFRADVLDNIKSADRNTKQKEIRGPGRFVAAMLIAASFSAVFLLVNFNLNFIQTQNSNDIYFSAEAINEYLEDNIDDIEIFAYADNMDMSLFNNSSNGEIDNIQSNSINEFLIEESDYSEIEEFYNQ